MYDKSEKLERLIKIADLLDTLDREEDANLIEEYIREEAGAAPGQIDEVEFEIPEEELAQIKEIYKSMGESLPQED